MKLVSNMTKRSSLYSLCNKLITYRLLAFILIFNLTHRCSLRLVFSFVPSVKKTSFHSLQLTLIPKKSSPNPSIRLFYSLDLMKELSANRNEHGIGQECKPQNVTLVPLSRHPLILTSSEPIITKEECQILINGYVNNKCHGKKKDKILAKVNSIIDTLTNCPSHDGEMQPRLLIYDPVTISTDADIIPDGLHVDVNNGKLFRHMTVLLYLTDNNHDRGCATTFPIAVPVNNSFDDENDLIQSAKNLIDNKIYHTQNQEEKYKDDVNLLERATIHLCNKEQFKEENQRYDNVGIRVIPKAGCICVFSSLLDNGLPDPLTFHGGESCINRDNYSGKAIVDGYDCISESSKIVLSFFKEIPLASFDTFKEFASNVCLSRKWLINQYY